MSTPPRSGPWIENPPWDVFWVLSFLWLGPLVLLLGYDLEDPTVGPVDTVYFFLTIAFWIGHRLSSTWLAYFTTAYRPLLRAQRVRFVWVPVAILALVGTLLLLPDDALPFSRAQRVMGLAILDYGLVTYHFAAQHFGFLSLYRTRAGHRRSPQGRRIDRAYALGVGGVLVFVAEIATGTIAFQDVWIDPVLDPALVAEVHGVLTTVVSVLVGAALLGVLLLELRQARPSLPRALYLVQLAALVLAALHLHPFLFLVLWTAQHWMAAMGLASLAPRREPSPGPGRWYRPWHAVNRRAWALVLVLAVLSLALTPAMEVEAVAATDARYGDRLFPFAAGWWRGEGIVPILVALGFVTAFLHYALDRAVWRFSDAAVRRAAAGVLGPARERDAPSAPP